MSIDIRQAYKEHCLRNGVQWSYATSVLSYDNTTLFCPAGMQQFKPLFKDVSYSEKTLANIQPCIRLNDLDLLGDGTHFAYFNMMGLFSFRDWSMYKAVSFWMDFLQSLKIKVTATHIHPNKYAEWLWMPNDFYRCKIIADPDCTWTDGEIGGYCMEFYVGDVEIGNIVNPLGTCIDVGFGFERLDQIVNKTPPKTEVELLCDTALKIIEADIEPSNQKQGYALRKMLRKIYNLRGSLDHEFFRQELDRQKQTNIRYLKLKNKYPDKDAHWWFDTHGIDITIL